MPSKSAGISTCIKCRSVVGQLGGSSRVACGPPDEAGIAKSDGAAELAPKDERIDPEVERPAQSPNGSRYRA